MRRGLMLIQGDVGDFCGSRLLAGSIVVAGSCGAQPGFGLRRGSLILAHAPHAMPATFGDAGVADLTYLGLLRRQVRDILPGVLPATSRVHRYMGDLAFGGKGEILIAT
jgi:formylmethanofuran dehydrogenase subunit C